ncbi:MAG: FadR family transcriptional regulator [Novosphingobium sp.]|nr:FadR family transcriptional regulator [Novosphingobium sp.]
MATSRKNMAESRNESAVDLAAKNLREIALASEDGEFLGSEDELVARLGVSKPTLRQATARIAQEHLVHVRRGVGGGYFARRPGSLTVSRMAAVYLRTRDATYVELTETTPMFYAELARLASRNRDPEMIARLRQFAERDENTVDEKNIQGYAEFMRSEREFIGFLADMAGNKVLELMVAITSDFSANAPRNDQRMLRKLDNMAIYRKLRARFARAIANGDGDIAELLSRRCTDLMCEWMREGFEDHAFQVGEMR